MKLNLKILPVLQFVLLASLSLWSQDTRMNIAVGSFEANGLPESDVNILTDRLRSELSNTGVFRVMERSQMDAILSEQSFQQSGACNTSECQVKIGQLLSVDRMVVGSIGLLGGSIYTISARLLDVGSGEVVLTANADYQGTIAGLLSQTIPELVHKLAGQKSEESSTPVDLYAGKTGDLFVATAQAGATVLLDGNAVEGLTPLTLAKIPAGKHQIAVRLGNAAGQLDTVVPPNGLVKINVPLIQRNGTLKVSTDPPGMKLLLDGQKKGSTPLLLEKISAGSHELLLTSKEYLPLHLQAEVMPDSIVVVDTSLRGLPKLNLAVTPENALVILGTDSFPEWNGFRYVPSGLLRVNVSSPGFQSYGDTLEITGDISKTIVLKQNRMSMKRKLALVFLGVGVASGGAGAYFNSKGASYKDDYNAATERSVGEAAYDDMDDMKTYRNISYGVALGTVLVGAVLWLWPE
ncbi:MAG TPA: PEGA domain-containing protein [Fibrobacteraceae bacterium]|nr:PEGA domain-containing protein [Fibrobacteraceae bacterium]